MPPRHQRKKVGRLELRETRRWLGFG
jgi:hypothetical protein